VALRLVFYAFIFCLPFEGAGIGVGSVFLIQIVGIILAGLALCQLRLFFKSPPKAFWFFAAYVCVFLVLGSIEIMNNPQDAELSPAIRQYLFRLIQFLILFSIVHELMKYESIVRGAFLALGFSCIILSLLQISGMVVTNWAQGRISTFEDNPIVIASVLSLGLLGIVGLGYVWKDATPKVRLLAWLSCGILLSAIVRTGSRGALIALLLALMALTLGRASLSTKAKTAVIGLAVTGFTVWTAYQIPAVRERFERTYYEGDMSGRQDRLAASWEMFLEKPIIGWGPVEHVYEHGSRINKKGDPHNLILWLLNETGVLGTIPFLIGFWLCLRSAWMARGGPQRGLPFAQLLYVFIVSMVAGILYYKWFWVIFAYALASGSSAFVSSRIPMPLSAARVRTRARRTRFGKSVTYYPH
jgi:O-antigen ligase